MNERATLVFVQEPDPEDAGLSDFRTVTDDEIVALVLAGYIVRRGDDGAPADPEGMPTISQVLGRDDGDDPDPTPAD